MLYSLGEMRTIGPAPMISEFIPEYERGLSYSPYLRCRRILIVSQDRVLIARISHNLVNFAIHGPGTSERGGL